MPFKLNVLKALKIGYSVLKKIEGAEAAGLIPAVSIKGVPLDVLDKATTAYATVLVNAHKGPTSPRT